MPSCNQTFVQRLRFFNFSLEYLSSLLILIISYISYLFCAFMHWFELLVYLDYCFQAILIIWWKYRKPGLLWPNLQLSKPVTLKLLKLKNRVFDMNQVYAWTIRTPQKISRGIPSLAENSEKGGGQSSPRLWGYFGPPSLTVGFLVFKCPNWRKYVIGM